MMKLLVFSDSHGDVGTMIDFVEAEKPDEIIHLGDCIQDAQTLSYTYPEIPVSMVPGNCDFCINKKGVLSLEREGFSLLMAHGHQWRVKSGPALAMEYARDACADVLLYGHTHEAGCWREYDMWVMNPGTVGGKGARASCGVIETIDRKLHCRLLFA